MTDELDPAEALALAQGTRERMAARAYIPAWYGPIYGLLCGVLVAGGGTAPPFGLLMVAVSIAALGLLYRTWSNRAGLSVNGYRPGRTRAIAIGLAVCLVMLMLAGLVLNRQWSLTWAPFAFGAVASVIAYVASAAWDRAWKAQLEQAR
jgi:hypothetical protein